MRQSKQAETTTCDRIAGGAAVCVRRVIIVCPPVLSFGIVREAPPATGGQMSPWRRPSRAS
eukprot:scaffold81565_cov13-Prasinocladus_malaysianus.AAC.1